MHNIASDPSRLHPSGVEPGRHGSGPSDAARDDSPGPDGAAAGGGVAIERPRSGGAAPPPAAAFPRVSRPGVSSSEPSPAAFSALAGKGETSPVVAVDGLHFAGTVPWLPSRWNAGAWQELWDTKKGARHAQDGKLWADVCGLHVKVRSGGHGKGAHALPLVLELLGGAVVVMLDSRQTDCGAFRPVANLRVEIHGTACVLHGAAECVELVRKLVADLGGDLRPALCWPTRADVAADLPGQGIGPAATAARCGRLTAKSIGDLVVYGPAGEERQIACGKSSRIRWSIYDKLREVRERAAAGSDGQAYRAAMVAKRWGGEEPAEAIRAEFQCGREWLREQGFRTLADLLGDLPRLCEIATRDRHPFFKLTARRVDRANRNHARAGTSRLWAKITAALRSWKGWTDQPAAPARAEIVERVDPKRERSAGLSYFTKALTAANRHLAGPKVLLDLAAHLVDLHDSPAGAEAVRKVNAAAARYRARLGMPHALGGPPG